MYQSNTAVSEYAFQSETSSSDELSDLEQINLIYIKRRINQKYKQYYLSSLIENIIKSFEKHHLRKIIYVN